jgi:PhoH-like ATPase
MAEKIYVLDTNVLLYSPDALFGFEGAHVGIPSVVLEELDGFKREGTDKGRAARQVIRSLDELRNRGSLGEGVKLDNGGTIRVLLMPSDESLKLPYKLSKEDNEILFLAYALQKQGKNVILISKDLNVRVKADSLGIKTEDYLKEHVTQEDFYRGWIRVAMPAGELKREVPEEVQELINDKKLEINQFVLLESQHNPHNYRIIRYIGNGKCIDVQEPHFKWALKARNAQQLMALDLLMDKSVKLVSLFGTAGTGKTLLALLAGLHQVLIEDEYEKLLVARPVVPLGRDIGFLPGTMEEKLFTWMLPIYDNMEFILHAAGTEEHVQELQHENGEHRNGDHRDEQYRRSRYPKHDKYAEKRRRNHKHHHQDRGEGQHHQREYFPPLEALIKRGKLSLEAITYMRGRSIPYQFIFIDEVQNLSPHEVKTLVSRVGEGSKIILAGDPYQIDEPYLDFSSNGLVVTGERFKGQKLFGCVYMHTSVRSELSQLAADLL